MRQPNLDHHSESFAALVGRTAKTLARTLTDRLRDAGHDLTMEHWIVLVHLWDEDGQNQAKLGEMAGRHKTAMTRAITNLEEHNFVLRVPDQNDRRNKLIYLTKSGKYLRDELMPIASDVMAEALQDIPSDALEQCHQVLRRVLANLKEDI